jgi:hypothetical protein
MAVQLMSRVAEVSGMQPDLEQFFDAPTVAGLVHQLDAKGGRP